MHVLKINYKHIVGKVVYFMYKDELRRGIVSSIRVYANTKDISTYLTKKILNKLITIFKRDYPFDKINVIYSIDLVSKEGEFESSPHILNEEYVFGTTKELLNSIILKIDNE